MKKLLIGCGALVGFAVLGIIIVAIVGAVAGSRQSPQTVTSPVTTKPAAAPADSPKPVAAQPTEKPAAKPEPKPLDLAKVGDRVESAGIAITVNSVKRADAAGQFMKAKPGRTFVIADVTIESVSRDNAPYNPLYFKVKDADGREYTANIVGVDDSLKHGELPKGEKARGNISFDVPTEAKGLVLSYQPIVLFGGYQTIRVQID